MNVAVFMVRAKQMGLSLAEMDELEEGFITDMIIETGNDNYDGYREIATQSDFDNF